MLAGLISQQGLIDSQFTEFIRHDRHPHTLLLRLFKQMPNKRGFSRTQKAGHDQRRYTVSDSRHVTCRLLGIER